MSRKDKRVVQIKPSEVNVGDLIVIPSDWSGFPEQRMRVTSVHKGVETKGGVETEISGTMLSGGELGEIGEEGTGVFYDTSDVFRVKDKYRGTFLKQETQKKEMHGKPTLPVDRMRVV